MGPSSAVTRCVLSCLLSVGWWGCDQTGTAGTPDTADELVAIRAPDAPARWQVGSSATDPGLERLQSTPVQEVWAWSEVTSVAEHLPLGRCTDQDDCGPGSYCAATAPGINECIDGEPPQLIAPRAPNGRPPPPLFLVDGQVLREHSARRSR